MNATIKTNTAETQNNPLSVTEDTGPATYTFKTTEENKDNSASIYVTPELEQFVKEQVIEGKFSHRWRSFSQFLNDALIHYLNGEEQKAETPASEVLEKASWSSDNILMANITDTLFEQIEILVNQIHTPWGTKQEFQICALYNYIEMGMPVVIHRR
jgi:hypothetical protein